MFKKLLTRIKNPKVLLAVASGVLLILVNLQIIDLEMSARVTDILNTALSIGVSIGVFGNPESHVEK
jgi:uncharacterized membrane protein